MQPEPGKQLLRFVGDRIAVRMSCNDACDVQTGGRVFLRTSLGQGRIFHEEVKNSHTRLRRLEGKFYRDIPMRKNGDTWEISLPLIEPGFFYAKPYLLTPDRRQHWPEGPDLLIMVHPNEYRTANTIYCAFTRLLGKTASLNSASTIETEKLLESLEKERYTVIPESGKLRDVVKLLPHITDTLGCRIIHLLPVNPTPTTYARFGRIGSPYACWDMTAIDPALIEFDRRSTGIEQFRELVNAVHAKGARLFLDISINHTGWGANLQEQHPDWYLRMKNGEFVSPGAWGITWEDLCELDHSRLDLWEHLAEVFLTWCRRGVDGFRCDAGYMIPPKAWQFITSCVKLEFPNTIFLLEGLGGPWESTETLLSTGGMQWAYSELFQNYSAKEIADYLEYSTTRSQQTGLWIHYSETHDNNRLAAHGKDWSLLRNRLCALAAVCGGFGFTSGVEWLATEKIDVHRLTGLNWGCRNNIVNELANLNHLVSQHPCFLDGATIIRLSPPTAPVLALLRTSAEALDTVLVLVNTDTNSSHAIELDESYITKDTLSQLTYDLISNEQLEHTPDKKGFNLAPAQARCLAVSAEPAGMIGHEYRIKRAQAEFVLTAVSHVIPIEDIGPFDWRKLAELLDSNPHKLLHAVTHLSPETARSDLVKALQTGIDTDEYPFVLNWTRADANRIMPVPPKHWLLVEDEHPFTASMEFESGEYARHVKSVTTAVGRHIAFFAPDSQTGKATLTIQQLIQGKNPVKGKIIRLSRPISQDLSWTRPTTGPFTECKASALLTNRRGGMAEICIDLGNIQSKYDCILGANLHPSLPVDRHVFVKRARVWANINGFLSPLDLENLVEFEPGPPAVWRFRIRAGGGHTIEISLTADMLPDKNTTLLSFCRHSQPDTSKQTPPNQVDVRLTIRLDIEDRNFHWETHLNPEAKAFFEENCKPIENNTGFEFHPADNRRLRVLSDGGDFHLQAELCRSIPHPLEQTRGMIAFGDAFSPGWFDILLEPSIPARLLINADTEEVSQAPSPNPFETCEKLQQSALAKSGIRPSDTFGRRILSALQAFLVKRGDGYTVIAGYPWFLDWGRDTLICSRGLLAAGMINETRNILTTFASLEENGTLPNSIHGDDTSNRDTSDAPLWFALACAETAEATGFEFFNHQLDDKGRTIADVIAGIATGYIHGTPNGVRVDQDSGLVWSPSHFTWMDTNHPAGTPREGYTIEIQALWIKLLDILEHIIKQPEILKHIHPAHRLDPAPWKEKAEASLHKFFALKHRAYPADLLIAEKNETAAEARPDSALRCNMLWAVALDVIQGPSARAIVRAAERYLLVPGAIRSLAPLPVDPPLVIRGRNGELLNDPIHPYQGRYEGDEDTQRKPAYHNGTAWVFMLPVFCEALVKAWNSDPHAVDTARSYLLSASSLLAKGCIGHLPEILDGDAPHTQRGCGAQAWSASETFRIWKWLNP